MSELSSIAKAKIEEWALALGSLPTVGETTEMVEEVSAAEISEFCDSFGSAAGQLAIFFQMMVTVTEQAGADNDEGEMKLVLSGQALDRCKELAEEVLRHVDTSAISIEAVNSDDLH